MRTKRPIMLLALVVGVFIVGCSSVSTVHYDLNPITASSTSNTTTHAPLTRYRLSSVNMPEPIDIASLVVRQSNDSLMMLSNDKWVGSLGQVMQTALATTLTHELGMPPLPTSMAPNTKADTVTDIIVDVRQFEMQPGKQAILSALWQIKFHNAQRASITCYSTLTQPVTPGVVALVSAQQINVQQLGKQIAVAVNTARAPESANCQMGQT